MPLEDQNLRRAESAPGAPLPGAVEAALAGIQALPEDTLILIPTRNLVLFPGTVLPITLGRQRTIAACAAAIVRWRPHRRRSGSAGRSDSCCSAIPPPMTRSRSTCIAWGPRRPCCAI